MSEIYQVKYRLNAQSSEIVQATHGLFFLINSKGSFICTIPDRIAHTTAFVTPALAGTRNSSMGPTPKGSIRRPIAP